MKRQRLAVLLTICMIMTIFPNSVMANGDFLLENVAEDSISGTSGGTIFREEQLQKAENQIVELTIDIGKQMFTEELDSKCDYNEINIFSNPVLKNAEGEIQQIETADLTASGSCGKNLTWILESDGTLIISGNGKMTNYSSHSQVPWYNEPSIVKSAIISNGVTTIGNWAFNHCTLDSVSIPDGVISIGDYAFYWCRLNNVNIPDGVTEIGEDAFWGNNLKSITIPNSITYIAPQAFGYCDNLTDVYFNGTEDEWKKISVNGLSMRDDIFVHYNGIDLSKKFSDIYFLSSWDSGTKKLTFGDSATITADSYILADDVDTSKISSMLDKYVRVTMEDAGALDHIVTDIEPVESKVGTVLDSVYTR